MRRASDTVFTGGARGAINFNYDPILHAPRGGEFDKGDNVAGLDMCTPPAARAVFREKMMEMM